MVRIWLCPMVTAYDAEFEVDVRLPKAGLILRGSIAAWSAVDMPGRNRAIVFVDAPAALQDAIHADTDCRYVTPHGVNTKAEMLAWLQATVASLPQTWKNVARTVLANHGLNLDDYLAGTVRELVDVVVRHHLRDQAPAVFLGDIKWAAL